MAQSQVEACEDELAARTAEIEAFQVQPAPLINFDTPPAAHFYSFVLQARPPGLWRQKTSAAEIPRGSSSSVKVACVIVYQSCHISSS